uniref:ARAD1D12540p n=1 Tax=Blastobotrys adeninivorans TaxID=409370 RepID=A0A060TF23_BLAAD
MPKRTYEHSGEEVDTKRDKVTKVVHDGQGQPAHIGPQQAQQLEQLEQLEPHQQHDEPHGDNGHGRRVHKDSKIVFYMGFQPSCHLCRAGVPGHYAHWVKS